MLFIIIAVFVTYLTWKIAISPLFGDSSPIIPEWSYLKFTWKNWIFALVYSITDVLLGCDLFEYIVYLYQVMLWYGRHSS